MALESYQLRGKNYDDVVRRLVETYNASEGWAVVRVVNRLTSLDVILERNSEQGVSKDTSADTSKDTVKATSKAVSKDTPTEKVVDADATASDEQLAPSTGTTQPLDTKEIVENPVAVKTTRKSQTKG